MKIKTDDLKGLVNKSLSKQGYNDQEAKVIAGVLLYAQFRGNNQGVVKLIGKGIPKREGAITPSIAKETPVSALINGNKTHAILVMDQITNKAIEIAEKSGIGIVGNFSTNNSRYVYLSHCLLRLDRSPNCWQKCC